MRVIVTAIQHRRLVAFSYVKDEMVSLRTCHPHILYISTAGNTCLDCYQVAGPSHGPLPGWRAFDLEFVRNVQILDEKFAPDIAYNPLNAKRYPQILAQVRL